ncbi:hypothetical protein BTM25_38940 [Actinomadura rubteroloni]|uniref:Uncharacterized protein n=1 Tax=Actinomadura rubteroloni TaxID=1926885 RepID=A0A2P4UJN3_9ACTN|nr:hypothetical protein [Actinomadura rubteroloni]POM25250.1 hypothetical protein BTM25_38940 [Actinomadura rubteroloni]
MAGRPLGPYIGLSYGHLISTTPGVVVTRDRWAVHPLALERPDHGRRDEPVRCATCGRTFTVRVLSLDRTLRLRRTLRASAITGLALSVLCAALLAVAGEGAVPVLAFLASVGAVTALLTAMRLRLEVGATPRRPTLTRLRGHRVLPGAGELPA